MICELDRESLEQRHAKWRLINFYKVIYYMINLTTSNLIPSTSPLYSHSLNFQRPYCATNYLKFSYFPRTRAQWNQLSYEQKAAVDLDHFKASLTGGFPSLAKY